MHMRQISPQHREATAQQGILPTALLSLGCLGSRLLCLSGNFGALAGPCTDTVALPSPYCMCSFTVDLYSAQA